MNRVIKFRAWDDQTKIMGVSFNVFDPEFLSSGGTFPGSCVFMQFTGLHDKNGKEIYEGDILISEPGNPMVVSWSNHFASFCLRCDGWAFSHWFGESCSPEQVEVIGNIYQNPELLK